jgi:anti-repressor protein
MSNLSIFRFQANQVRVILIEGQPWFVAKDVCDVLEVGNSRQALSRLDDDERGSFQLDTLGGIQSMSIISESGFYSLVLSSRKPQAKPFKK